jgi:hypothetical protein
MKSKFFMFCLIVVLILLMVFRSKYFDTKNNKIKFTTNSDGFNLTKTSIIIKHSKNEQISRNKIDPYPFSYILNSNETICEPQIPGNNLTFVAFIPCAVQDYQKRMILRNTWANYLFMNRNKMRYVFMIGLSTNQTVNKMVNY